MLFRKLNSAYGPNNDIIFGFMFICNEDMDTDIDFTIEDYEYILANLKNIKYKTRHSIRDWEYIMNNVE